jgi:DNA mismatch endonuclease (patch repair protein)
MVSKGSRKTDEERKALRRWADVDPDRSRQMALVRSKNTAPELIVRSLAHSLGTRFRLHRADLPGKPDLVFPGRRKVIFVHGCFWHGHPDPECRRSRIPKSRVEFWTNKIARNSIRDAKSEALLRSQGWSVLTVWECETPIMLRGRLMKKLQKFLRPAVAHDAPSRRRKRALKGVSSGG